MYAILMYGSSGSCWIPLFITSITVLTNSTSSIPEPPSKAPAKWFRRPLICTLISPRRGLAPLIAHPQTRVSHHPSGCNTESKNKNMKKTRKRKPSLLAWLGVTS